MAEFVYPDMDYQEKVYYEMLWKFQGEDLNTPKNHKTLKGKIKKCKCPSCGRHCASFFRSHNNDTFIMTCMEGCGLKKTLQGFMIGWMVARQTQANRYAAEQISRYEYNGENYWQILSDLNSKTISELHKEFANEK